MNKIISRIAIALASFAMVIGGVSTVAAHNKEQAKPAYADGNNVVAALNTTDVVNYGHKEWIREDWKVSWGGSYHCGFEYNEWKTIEEQGYSKYVDGAVVTADSYGFVVASQKQLSYVGGFDFLTSLENRNSKLYLTYSTDGESYSLVPFTSGEQGTGIRNDDVTLSFDFDSIRRAYYAIIVVSTYSTIPSRTSFQFDFVSNFYEKIDPNAERITVDGPHEVYVDEEIELTVTLYNFDPTEYTWVSSDESVLTITGSGSTATVRGAGKGTASITVSATGTSELIYTDPFVINVKEFKITDTNVSINLSAHGSDCIYINYQDHNGSVVAANNSIENDIIRVVLEPSSNNKYFLQVYAKEIVGVTCSFDVVLRDNNGQDGYHEATITVQVNIAAKQILSERMTSLPTGGSIVEVPIYLGTIDGSRFLKMSSSSSLEPVDDIKDAYVFYIHRLGKIRTVSKLGNTYSSVTLNFGQYMVASTSSTYFNIYNNIDNYPGMLMSGNNNDRSFMYIDSQERICSGNSNDLDYCIENGTISPSNVFCAYAATEVNTGIYPEETAVDLNKGESTSIDTSLVFVNDIEYEIISGASCIDSVAIANITNYTETSVTITASDTRGTAVIRVKDANDDSVYTDITVNVKVDAETEVGNISTQTSLAYHYSKDELGNFTYSNVSIRFGGKINKDLWNEIDEDYDIAGFGVMITGRVDQLRSLPPAGYTISDHVADAVSAESATDLDTQLVNHYMSKAEMAVPPELGDDYAWNLMQSITIDDASDVMKVYTAAAYIKLDNGDYLFFEQVETSVFSLAYGYLNGGGYNSSSVGGSLQNLLDMTGQE